MEQPTRLARFAFKAGAVANALVRALPAAASATGAALVCVGLGAVYAPLLPIAAGVFLLALGWELS